MANPEPKFTKKSLHSVCPIAHDPNLAPTIAKGIPIKQNQ
jgi:hypothetical protein